MRVPYVILGKNFVEGSRPWMKQLYTRWGRNLDKAHVLEEYPRPLMVRENFVCLNGSWEYAFTKKFCVPEKYDGEILVPFSPESLLSGVNRQLQPDEYLWYRRFFETDRKILQDGGRALLHFGAVDQSCRVYVNGREVMRHTGGYLPFEGDITESLVPEENGRNELVVAVKDLSDTSYHARGKQKLKCSGMFYTAQSGIWQTVWMEYVPKDYIKEVTAEPDLDRKTVRITVTAEKDLPVEIRIREPGIYKDLRTAEPAGAAFEKTAVSEGGNSAGAASERTAVSEGGNSAGAASEKTAVSEGGNSAGAASKKTAVSEAGDSGRKTDSAAEWITETGTANQPVEIPLPEVRAWNCEEPWLYYFTVIMGGDRVESYFALRTFTVEPDETGVPRICLNHQVQFQKGVLDQGYWSDGLYTPASDEAFLFDIQAMKDMGFNMIRKHLKIEPQRWYYHCDRLGMVVWQDMVNGGTDYKHWFVTYAATLISWRNWKLKDGYTKLLSRTDKEGRLEFVKEMKETARILKGHPSIAVWVIFNEGWGQFQTEEMTGILRKADPSRLIDQASGWFDQGGGDFQSIHNYFFKLKFQKDPGRAAVLSEYGGYNLREGEHSVCVSQYGYGTYESREALNQAYRKREKEVESRIPDGLCASIYTQLSDVEEEVNGIFTFDREIKKIDG